MGISKIIKLYNVWQYILKTFGKLNIVNAPMGEDLKNSCFDRFVRYKEY